MEKKVFYKSDKNKLCGLLSRVNDNNTMIILCHGYNSDKHEMGVFDNLTKSLEENNINSFRFDFRSFGESSGEDYEACISGEIVDLCNTIEYLKSLNYQKFILLGSSYGGCIVSCIDHSKYNILGLVSWYGALDFNRIPKSIYSDELVNEAKINGYICHKHFDGSITRMGYKALTDMKKYNASKHLIKLNIPILFVHGTKDKLVPYEISFDTNVKCKKSEILLIDNSTHLFNDSKESLNIAINETIKFIKNII